MSVPFDPIRGPNRGDSLMAMMDPEADAGLWITLIGTCGRTGQVLSIRN